MCDDVYFPDDYLLEEEDDDDEEEEEEEEEEEGESPIERRPRIRKLRRVKKLKKQGSIVPEEIYQIAGVAKIKLLEETQKNIACVVGEDITDENPWKYVQKEDLQDNIEFFEDKSDFFELREQILAYPRPKMIVGYIPSENPEVEEFYFCTTEAAEETVASIMDRVKTRREERLENSLLKKVGIWKTQGSENEVNQMQLKSTRPFLEVEVEAAFPIIKTKSQFRLRMSEINKNSYVETLSLRSTFYNLMKKRMDAGCQITPSVMNNTAQTYCSYPQNKSTQYQYDYREVTKLSREFHKNIKLFVENKMDDIDDLIYVNSYINFYANDYMNLVKNEALSHKAKRSRIKELFDFFEPNLTRGKIITSLSWHQMWTGTLAAAYGYSALSTYTKPDPKEDEVLDAIYDQTPVLLWCFNDHLSPKLLLKSPREVTALSFCPYEENILIGGCQNGMIIIWDITDKIRRVEEQEILTPNQLKYRLRMMSLMEWMKDIRNPKIVEATVISDMRYSHTGAVTSIRWRSPYRETSKSGKVMEIPEEENRTSRQFMTSAKDGTVLTWDLLARPGNVAGGYKPHRKLRRLKRRPSALITDVSPLKELNRVFRPIFKVLVFAPNTSRPLPITQFSVNTTNTKYVEKNPVANRKISISERVYFEPIFRRPTHPLANEFIAGSGEGDVLIANWEGFEFNAGEVVNKEYAKISSFGKFHDGPVVALSRSAVFNDIILTVGGKVFALWKMSFLDKPFFWRKCECRYTHGIWNSYRPTMFRLTRADGNLEMWHLKTRSDRYEDLKSVSGGTLLGTFTHPRSMKINVIGISDNTGSFRVFHAAQSLIHEQKDDARITGTISEREVDRKIKFMEWQEKWKVKNAAYIEARWEQQRAAQKQKEEELARAQELKDQQGAEGAQLEPETSFAERARENWKEKEVTRMVTGLLQKKQLNMDTLLQQQVPALKQAKEELHVEEQRHRRQSNADRMFNETVKMLFPDAVEKKPPPPPDPYGGGDSTNVKIAHYRNYEELVEECQISIDRRDSIKPSNWMHLVKKGKERRKWLDGQYMRRSHRDRLIEERNKGPSIVSIPSVSTKTESSKSLVYADIGDGDEA